MRSRLLVFKTIIIIQTYRYTRSKELSKIPNVNNLFITSQFGQRHKWFWNDAHMTKTGGKKCYKNAHCKCPITKQTSLPHFTKCFAPESRTIIHRTLRTKNYFLKNFHKQFIASNWCSNVLLR